MDTGKVLVIGVDAATFDLIDPWAAEGILPNFRRLMENGTRGTLWTVPNMNSAPAWTSFATGKNPGKHGIYFFTRPKPGTYEMEVINGSYRDGLTFWQIASQYGKRVGVINVPMTYPADAVNGFLISGLDTPGKHAPGWVFPSDLMAQIPQELGEYIIECGLPSYAKSGRLDKGLDVAHQTIEQRTRYSLYLMDNHPWDLFVTVYTSIDAVQHYFWRHMLLSGKSTPQKHRFQNAIRAAYIQVDQAIGELVRQAPPGTTVIIVSDHGAGSALYGFRNLRDWLVTHGYMTLKNTESTATLQMIKNSLLRQSYRWLDAHFSREFKLFLSRSLPGIRSKIEANIGFAQVDWARTQLYFDMGVELRVNLKGREPRGIVEPGEEYEALRDEVIAALLKWRDPKSGVRFVADVKRREEVYTGPHLAEAADLLIRWNDASELPAIYEANGDNQRDYGVRFDPDINGGHRLNGILIAHGPGVKSGCDTHGAQIWDVAPTVLYLAGVSIPKDMDGKLLRQIFVKQLLEQRPPEYVDLEGIDLPRLETRLSGEDEELVKERLRGLGYIE